jgi:hypothetical protein
LGITLRDGTAAPKSNPHQRIIPDAHGNTAQQPENQEWWKSAPEPNEDYEVTALAGDFGVTSENSLERHLFVRQFPRCGKACWLACRTARYRFLVGEAESDSGSGSRAHLLDANYRSFAMDALVATGLWSSKGYAHSRSHRRLEICVEKNPAFTEIADDANVCPSHSRTLHLSSSMHEGTRAGTRNYVASVGKNHSTFTSCTWEATRLSG